METPRLQDFLLTAPEPCPPLLGDSMGHVGSRRGQCLLAGGFWRKPLSGCSSTFTASVSFLNDPGILESRMVACGWKFEFFVTDQPFLIKVILFFSENKTKQPWPVAQLVGVSSHSPKGCRFNPCPGTPPRQPIGVSLSFSFKSINIPSGED